MLPIKSEVETLKRFLTAFLVIIMLLSLASCGKKKEEMNGNNNLNEDEMPDIKNEENNLEDEIPPENEDEHDLGIDDNPELKPEGYIDPKKHINIYVTRKESEMDDGPDYFYYDTQYRYYFEKMQSPYTFVSVDGEPYLDIASALAGGLTTVEELEQEGLKICFELITDTEIQPQVEITVLYTEEGILLGKGKFNSEGESVEPHNIIVYSDSAAQHKKGDILFISYTAEQLVKCETEEGDDPEVFTYKVLKEGFDESLPESYEEVKFVIEYKLVDAEIYTD